MNIIFVCHGNICRSPMAEYIMKYLLEDYHTEGVYVSSAGVSSEENGNDIYPPAKRILKAHGIPFSSHRAHRITDDEFNNSDLVIALDRSNLNALVRRFGKNSDLVIALDRSNLNALVRRFGKSSRIMMLLSRDVEDPWYTDDFETAYEDILSGCKALLSEIRGDANL